MADAAKTSAEIYRDLGPLAFLIVVGCLAFCYMVWRIVQAQDKIAETQAAMLLKMLEQDGRSGLIQQNQEHMHATCRDHGEKIEYLHKGIVDFKEEVTEEIAGLQTDVKLLKEKVG